MHFLHHAAAMKLDRGFAQTDFGRDLLVELSGYHKESHFPFLNRQAVKSLADPAQLVCCTSPIRITRDRRLNGVQQFLRSHRLGKKVCRARLYRANRHGHVSMRAYKDDWHSVRRADVLFIEIETTPSRQSHVKHHAARPAGPPIVKKMLDRGKRASVKADR